MAKLHKIYNPMFDTLAFVKKLTVAGVPAQQAEAQAEMFVQAFSEAMDNKLATKQDILNLKQELAILKIDMIKWMLTISLMQVGLIVSLLKLIH